MAVSISMAPIKPADFGFAQARHLLNRAGFGGTPTQIAALQKMGPRDAVDYLVEFERIDPQRDGTDAFAPNPDYIRPRTRAEQMRAREARQSNDRMALEQMNARRRLDEEDDRRQMALLARRWLAEMIATPRPLEEKLTLFWHGHFAANFRTVRDSFLMHRQNDFFRANAAGSFADLAHGVVRDPAMIRFLDNHNNRKEKPNENLARELMELFTLGEGHYAERDIKEGARALTGYGLADNDFRFHRNLHDDGEKTILGKRGSFDGDGFVDVILGHPQCARFVCARLYDFFVADIEDATPSHARSVINMLAVQLRKCDYELKPILKALFLSEHFYHPANRSARIKSPAELIVSTIRGLGAPPRDLSLLSDAAAAMGQQLFDPPSVAGWAGGRGWINTATLFVRHNTVAYLLTGKLPYQDNWTPDAVNYDPTFLLEGEPKRDAHAVVTQLLNVTVGPQVGAQRKQQLTAYLTQRGAANPENLLALLLLITTTPEYQLC